MSQRTKRSAPAAALRVLTYNAFCGPPLPGWWSAASGSASALQRGGRLKAQAAAILALAPDVICLQEILADSARELYIRALTEDYEPSYAVDGSVARRMAKNGLTVCIWVLCAWLIGQQGSWGAFAVAVACCLLGVTAACHTALWGYVFGDTAPSGLLIFTKRSRLTKVGPPEAAEFTRQDGDWMNIWRPRMYTSSRHHNSISVEIAESLRVVVGGVLWQRLRLQGSRRMIVVGNAHADALSRSLPQQQQIRSVLQPSADRRAQLCELFTEGALRAKQDGGARVVVMGDFNTGQADDPWLSSSSCSSSTEPRLQGFQDAWRSANGDAPCYTLDSERNSLLAGGHWSKCQEVIDYVHVSTQQIATTT